MVSVVRDVTPRKQLEEELSGYRQRLEEMVAKRTTEFAETNKKLTEALAEHEKTEAALLLRATILDNAGEAIFLVDPQGEFVVSIMRSIAD